MEGSPTPAPRSPEAAALLERYPRSATDPIADRAEERWIAVPGGSLRVVRIAPSRAGVRDASQSEALPVLFVPGWGGVIDGFRETLRAIEDGIELFYVETREKRSSRLSRRTSFSMERIGADVGVVAAELGLEPGRFILAGSSFGGGVVAQALADGRLRPRIGLLYDPMPRLWMPRWIMNLLVPLMPAWLITVMRPGLKRLVVAGMQEATQRRRAERFIDDAVLWKWRAVSLRLRDWDIHRVGPTITSPVHVLNGSADRFHDSGIYPAIARSIPGARLARIPVPESRREHLIGALLCAYARAYANVSAREHARGAGTAGLPAEVAPFEVDLRGDG